MAACHRWCDVQIIRNALVYDGTGASPQPADVAVDGDRIAAIGTVNARGDEIDARGLALAPGFIDVHTHDDFAAVLHPEMAFKVRGGVTTCIVGNCGMGAAPFRQAALLARSFHPAIRLPDWGDHGYLDLLAYRRCQRRHADRHGTVRMAAMGRERGAPRAQMAEINPLVWKARRRRRARPAHLQTGAPRATTRSSSSRR
jgi:N-acyl-D-aspartate/D-glutamate deacylase